MCVIYVYKISQVFTIGFIYLKYTSELMCLFRTHLNEGKQNRTKRLTEIYSARGHSNLLIELRLWKARTRG